MRNVLAVAERELKAYFASPLAYVVTAFFLFVAGYLFAAIVASTREATLRYLLSNLSVIWLFITPALTMRLLAEEARTGTIELLLTNPIREVEIVFGKYLAALGLLLVMLVFTLYFPLLLFIYGNPDPGPILTGYLGVVLQAAAFMGVGLLASSLTQNQIIAAVITFALLLALWLADAMAGQASGALAEVIRYLSVTQHFQDFPRGIVDTKDLVYFLSVIAVSLFLTTLVLQARRWR
jgi:ABC-2 type transport system permease protein